MKTRMMLAVCLIVAFLLLPDTEHAVSMKSYRITPQTEPIDPVLRAYSTYNAQTRNHYTLRSQRDSSGNGQPKTGHQTMILRFETMTSLISMSQSEHINTLKIVRIRLCAF